MAQKTINFVIKVNNKEVDLTKTSFKQFDDIIKQAKKDLKDLPLNDPRYKGLVSDIKTAESAWKASQKAASQLGDEMDKGEQTTKTYTAQIKELTKANIALKDSGQEASQAYVNNEAKIKSLRDAQEEMQRSTQKLDDALSNIPGPIGQIGQSMQSMEMVTGSAKSAFGSLTKMFPILDNAIAASGIGALVLLLGLIVAAVIKAAKSFQPLQDAFAVLGDAVGAVFDALKPITDFILKVFVGAIEIAAKAIEGLASIFGGVSNGFKQQTLNLDRSINRQKQTLDDYSVFLSEHYTSILQLQQKYDEKKKALLEDDKKNTADKNTELIELDVLYRHEKDLLQKKYDKITRDRTTELTKLEKENNLKSIDNDRVTTQESIRIAKIAQEELANSEIKAANGRRTRMMVLQGEIIKIQDQGSDEEKKRRFETLEALNKSIKDEKINIEFLQDQKIKITESADAELNKNQRAFNRENISLINERSLAVMDLGTQLLKDEEARNLQQASFAINTLKEQHRKELEDTKLSGVTLKGLKQKQDAEMLAALETQRKATIQYDSWTIQQEIDKQNRLVTKAGIGTIEYFNAKKEIADKELEKELLEADGNNNKIENARTKHWETMLTIDKEKLQTQISQIQTEYNGLYDGTVASFEKMRELEDKQYELQQKEAQGNYDKLEALRQEHEKKINMIEVASLQSKAELEGRKAATINSLTERYYDYRRNELNTNTQAELIAAGDNEEKKLVIRQEYLQKNRDIDAQEFEASKAILLRIEEVTVQFGQTLSSIGNALMADAQGRDKKKFDNAKKIALAGLLIEKAAAVASIWTNNAIANAKATAAFPLTLGQPWVTLNTVSAALSTAALIAATAQAASQINGQDFSPAGGGSGGGTSGGTQIGSKPNYGDGGMIDGPRHAQGGVAINAEGGEAVMTRGAVTMFKPLLSMLNQVGGGTSFTKGASGQASYDNPKDSNLITEQQIIKTYVVEQDLTSVQHRNARLKDLSTL